MLLALLFACGGDRFGDEPLSVPRTAPWDQLGLPEGRAVMSGANGLTVRTEGRVAAVDPAWDAALRGLGFVVASDSSRGSMVSRVYRRGDGDTDALAERWALGLTELDGQVTVDLRVLP